MRKIKRRLMYSFSGMILGGAAFLAILQILSWAMRRQWAQGTEILRIYLAATLLLTVILALCNIALIRHEGFRIKNLVGTGLGLGWALGNLICLGLAGIKGLPVLRNFATVYGCYINLFLSGILLMAALAAWHKPAYDKDFVIIPGCSISKKGGLLPLLKGRTNRGIRFAWDQERSTGKPACYVPTGGQGPDEVMSEGSAMALYLLAHGAEEYEVFPEKASVNTYENLLFSKRIIDEKKPDARVCVVTTNYHVLRSCILARKVGLDAEGLASSTKWYFWPNGLAREVIAILSMYPRRQMLLFALCFILALFIK